MRQRRGGVYGPYQHRRQWRVDVVGPSGERSTGLFESEAAALEVIRKTSERLGLMSGVNVLEAIEKYEVHLRQKGNRPKSIDATKARLKRILAGELKLKLRNLSETRCRTAYHTLVEELAVDSHRNILAEMKTWARWCMKQGWIATSPAEGIEGVGRRSRGKDQLRVAEARAYAQAAFELAALSDGPIATLCALFMGMRASEIVERRVRDLDDEGRLMWIPQAKTFAGKRMLGVPDFLRDDLLRLAEGKKPEDWLFSSHRREWILDWVKRTCERAKVPEVSCHGLRGTYATLAIAAGLRARDVAESLGHADERITRLAYAKPESYEQGRQRKLEWWFGGTDGGKEEGPEGGSSEPSDTAPN